MATATFSHCVTKVRILPLIPLSTKVVNPNILGFLFCTDNSLTWAVTIFASPHRNFTKTVVGWPVYVIVGRLYPK